MLRGWYGLGRFWIEGLRTDSLYLFGTGVRVSQLVALVSVLVAAALLVRMLVFVKPDPQKMWVHRTTENNQAK